jgi:hypothetical protein
MTTRAIPTPAALAAPLAFDRFRWEEDVLSGELPFNARLVALVLAHCADAAGYLPADGPQNAHRVAERARLSAKQARVSLHQLEMAGYIRRPDIHTWQPRQIVRPVTLTRPAPATRTEPAHPSGAEG